MKHREVERNEGNTYPFGRRGSDPICYKGIQPFADGDIADVVLYAANTPEYRQIAEVLVLATHQANGQHHGAPSVIGSTACQCVSALCAMKQSFQTAILHTKPKRINVIPV